MHRIINFKTTQSKEMRPIWENYFKNNVEMLKIIKEQLLILLLFNRQTMEWGVTVTYHKS